MSSRKVGDEWITTHQAADGSWYEIRNRDTAEANMSLYSESKRNEALRVKALLEGQDRGRAERGRNAD